jgi:hypothetical protein
MKLTTGQLISLVIALGFAALLIYDAPFEPAAANPATSQVVYASVFEPPVIAGEPGRVDWPLLLLELGFVAFIGGGLFFITGQNKQRD